MFENILKHIDLIETNKEHILDMWMDYDIVQSKLTQNTMDITFFKNKFASKVFEFAFSVVKSENKTGDCPVIGVMLMLFKKKNIPLSDIFMICVHFKNALLHFASDNKILDDETLKELSMLMDYNFEGVINEYVLLYYKDSLIRKVKTPKSCSVAKLEPTPNNDNNESVTQEVTEQEDQEKQTTSAELYLQEVEVNMEMIQELDELESDTLDAIDAQETLDQNSIDESANLFRKYAAVLNEMYEFEELAYTLTLLADVLSEVSFEEITEETRFMVDIYLKAIISDLRSWRMSIFMTMEAEDIHYLDKTLLSSIAQIQMTLMPQVEGEEEDEIEFF